MSVKMARMSEEFFIEKVWVFKRVGVTLVVLGLVMQVPALYISPLQSPSLIAFNYALVLLGIAAIISNRIFESIQYSRLEKAVLHCTDCGWHGYGKEWFRCGCCPDCDSERVVKTGLETTQ